MLYPICAFVGGVAVVQWFAVLPSPVATACVIIGLGACLKPARRIVRPVLISLLFLFIGIGWASYRFELMRYDQLDPNLDGAVVTLEGSVTGLPVVKDHYLSFDFAIREIELNGTVHDRPRLARLKWYGDHPTMVPGENWRLVAKLKRPRGLSNPGGFDYERYLFYQGIGATGIVRRDSRNTKTSVSNRHSIDRIRFRVRTAIGETHDDNPLTPILLALAVGDRSGLSSEHRFTMQSTGTGHLLSISGLHITLAAVLGWTLISLLWRTSGTLMHWYPAQQAAILGGIILGSFYAALAGFSVPTTRALVMLATAAIVMVLCRRTGLYNGLAIAAVAVLLIDPKSIGTAGFWMSFIAVMILFLVARRSQPLEGRALAGESTRSKLQAVTRPLRRLALLQCLLAIGLAPWSALFFGQIPIFSPLANLIAVPAFSFTVVPLTLAGVAGEILGISGFASKAWAVALWVLEPLWNALQWLAESARATIQIALAPWQFGLAALGVLVVVKARRGWQIATVLVLITLTVLVPGARPERGELWISVLDVGQGLSVVLQTRSATILYDTGARYRSGFDLGAAVVVPYLHRRGIGRVDLLLISHSDNDHAGGLAAITRSVEVESVISSDTEKISASEPCEEGQEWRFDEVTFRVLAPFRDQYASTNDRSCVLLVTSKRGSVLLTGDIEQASEAALVTRYGDRLKADLLLIPHHGSRTSSTEGLLQRVDPQWAVVSRGHGNGYGHPHADVIARYSKKGISVFDTGRDGAIEVRFGSREMSADRHRFSNRRIWRTSSESEPATSRRLMNQ